MQLPSIDANSFFVRAHGGVRFATGIVQRSGARNSLEIGVQIPAKSSGWSVLSDRNAKTNISEVDDLWMLDAMVKIPVSTWQYEGAPEGNGVLGTGVIHMGPMAQDFNQALLPLNLGKPSTNQSISRNETEMSRILTSDADGALLSATRGMVRRITSQDQELSELEEEVEKLMARVRTNNLLIEQNAGSILRHNKLLSEISAHVSAVLETLS
jgi:hypothetical protein